MGKENTYMFMDDENTTMEPTGAEDAGSTGSDDMGGTPASDEGSTEEAQA